MHKDCCIGCAHTERCLVTCRSEGPGLQTWEPASFGSLDDLARLCWHLQWYTITWPCCGCNDEILRRAHQCQQATRAHRSQTCGPSKIMSTCHKCAGADSIQETPDDLLTHRSPNCFKLSACSPADEISRRQVTKSCIANESDGGIEECGGGNAAEGGPFHFAILSWALDGVLHTNQRLKQQWTFPVMAAAGYVSSQSLEQLLPAFAVHVCTQWVQAPCHVTVIVLHRRYSRQAWGSQ